MKSYPQRMIELADKLSEPTPWKMLKNLPDIRQRLQAKTEEVLREIAKHDPVLPMYITNQESPEDEMFPNPEYQEMYPRLKRIDRLLCNDPEIAELKRYEKEINTRTEEFIELDGLVNKHAWHLLSIYDKYFDLTTGDPEKQARAMRNLYASLKGEKQQARDRRASQVQASASVSGDYREYKDGGLPKGDLLTVSVIDRRYQINGPTLSKKSKETEELNGKKIRIQNPETRKGHVYLWAFVKKLAD